MRCASLRTDQPVRISGGRRGGQGDGPRRRSRAGGAGVSAERDLQAVPHRRRPRGGSAWVSRSARASSRQTEASCVCRPTPPTAPRSPSRSRWSSSRPLSDERRRGACARRGRRAPDRQGAEGDPHATRATGLRRRPRSRRPSTPSPSGLQTRSCSIWSYRTATGSRSPGHQALEPGADRRALGRRRRAPEGARARRRG